MSKQSLKRERGKGEKKSISCMKEQNHVYLASEFVKVVIYTGFDFSLVWSFSHEILDDHASIIPKSPFCRFEAFRQRAYFTDLSATFGCVQKRVSSFTTTVIGFQVTLIQKHI